VTSFIHYLFNSRPPFKNDDVVGNLHIYLIYNIFRGHLHSLKVVSFKQHPKGKFNCSRTVQPEEGSTQTFLILDGYLVGLSILVNLESFSKVTYDIGTRF